MQKLYFEPAWDKTIAKIDRERIQMMFETQTRQLKEGITFSLLWEAKNYKSERLVTVLIHNSDETTLSLQKIIITYCGKDQQINSGIFTVPHDIASKTTMPWTFIFSTSNQTLQKSQYTIQS